jgi:peptidoglycan-associated lipoprotein
MTSAQQRAVSAIAVVVTLATGCGAKRANLTPTSPSGRTMVVLLPEPDGSVGRASVSTPSGSADLTHAREGVRVIAGQPLTPPTILSDQDVDRIFGRALSALPPAPTHFTLYFQFQSDELTDESRALVPAIQKAVSERPIPDIIVVGHTDTTGTTAANFELGLKRAMFVRNLLTAAGLDASSIEVSSLGEADPLVRTPDDTPEPRNRRVEIGVR